MPTLIRNKQGDVGEKLATFFENKTRFLTNKFFPASLSADLSDIVDMMYLLSVHCLTVIMKKKITKIMKKLNSNKTFKLNNIIN